MAYFKGIGSRPTSRAGDKLSIFRSTPLP